MMQLVVGLLALALVFVVVGAIVHVLWWLFVFAVLAVGAAYVVRRVSGRV